MRKSPISRNPLDWLGSKPANGEGGPAPDTAEAITVAPTVSATATVPESVPEVAPGAAPTQVPTPRPRRRARRSEGTSGLIRTTYHIRPELRHQVEEFAYWERLKIFQVVNQALSEFFERHPVKSE